MQPDTAGFRSQVVFRVNWRKNFIKPTWNAFLKEGGQLSVSTPCSTEVGRRIYSQIIFSSVFCLG